MSRAIPCAALIAGGVTAALGSIAAAAIAFAPPGSSSVLGDFLHIVIPSLPSSVTPGRLFAVVVGWTLGAAGIAAVIAWLGTGLPHRAGAAPAMGR